MPGQAARARRPVTSRQRGRSARRTRRVDRPSTRGTLDATTDACRCGIPPGRSEWAPRAGRPVPFSAGSSASSRRTAAGRSLIRGKQRSWRSWTSGRGPWRPWRHHRPEGGSASDRHPNGPGPLAGSVRRRRRRSGRLHASGERRIERGAARRAQSKLRPGRPIQNAEDAGWVRRTRHRAAAGDRSPQGRERAVARKPQGTAADLRDAADRGRPPAPGVGMRSPVSRQGHALGEAGRPAGP